MMDSEAIATAVLCGAVFGQPGGEYFRYRLDSKNRGYGVLADLGNKFGWSAPYHCMADAARAYLQDYGYA